MVVKTNDKLKRVRDEVKFVSHMHHILKNGLLGRDEPVVIGEEPTRRFYSGVLFPDYDSFVSQAEDTDFKDPQPIFKSLAKNCNLGLEFLCKEVAERIKLSISGSFKIYFRVLPTYKEQLNALDYLEASEVSENRETDDFPTDEIDNDSIEDDTGTNIPDIKNSQQSKDDDNQPKIKDKGLRLLEKYRSIEVNFNDLIITINPSKSDYKEFDLKQYIESAINEAKEWDDFFSVEPEKMEKTGFVKLDSRPSTELLFKQWLKSIKSKNVFIPGWAGSIAVEVRPYRNKDGKIFQRGIVTLINKTPVLEKDEKPTGHSLAFFDCGIQVKLLEGECHPFEFSGAPRDYKYDKKVNVKGLNCVGVLKSKDYVTLETECIPDYFQKHYRTREDLMVKFESLATPELTKQTLFNIASEMRDTLAKWKVYIESMGTIEQPLRNEDEKEQCEKEMKEFEQEIDSFELGIYSLIQQHDKRLMKAFNLMNKVFVKSGKGKYDSWRLFQIVFIVRILPSLYSREVKEIDRKIKEILDSNNYADVLWFPTGGGKTEAYLGLIVCSLFYDRLRGKKRGCSAWIRFPLRMLSKQQLDRLVKVLINAEEIRCENEEFSDDNIPFSIGFFAGGGNTPNSISENKKKSIFFSEKNRKKHMLLHKCPSCNQPLTLDFSEKRWRLIHKCNNQDCFVTKSKILKGILPIFITDSEVYRFVPNVLCGTVDKLAIISRYREFAHIFGQVGGICEQHGFFSDKCVVGKMDKFRKCDRKVDSTMKKKVQDYKATFYDPIPSLLIQDELHLLKEELGVLDGHYEGALNEFARKLGKRETDLPKVIAATATIESYEHHIRHLYIRKPRRYPSMGYINGESFYATSIPEINRRLYIGILPHAKSQEEVIGRCLYIYQKEIYRLYKESSSVWKSFNFESIDSEGDFLKFLAMYDLSVVYVNKKPLGHDILRRIGETTNPNIKRDVGQDFDLQTEILTGENEMDKIVDVIDRIESEDTGDYKSKLHTLVATSLISHGVDLERINAFFMAGMPSKQAEYIQASSRSARTHVGLVLVCFKPNDLRERSQYQYFVQNHIFLDRLVDPVPINRMSLKAIERSLPGLISALLYCLHSQFAKNTIANCSDYNNYVAQNNVNGKSIETEIVAELKRIIGTDKEFFTPTAREKAEKYIEKEFIRWNQHLSISSGGIKSEKVLNPITSFRDIEEGLKLSPNTPTAVLMSESKRG